MDKRINDLLAELCAERFYLLIIVDLISLNIIIISVNI